MKYLKSFQVINESFDISYFDVELREIKEWLYDFLDEHDDLDLQVYELLSEYNPSKKFNIIITIKGNSDPATASDEVMLTPEEYPIESYLPFLEDRLKERNLAIVSHGYGKMWPCIRITIVKI